MMEFLIAHFWFPVFFAVGLPLLYVLIASLNYIKTKRDR